MNSLDKLFRNRPASNDFADGYLDYLSHILSELDRRAIGLFIDTLLYARERESSIFFIGNGGSASTASHFANDIAVGTKTAKKPFRAISLCDNSAILTALSNDYGFEHVFSRQLQTYMKPGDVLVAISVSGNSPNILEAARYANAHDAITMGVTGFSGGLLKEISKVNVHVPTNEGEYGPAEDIHLILNHLVSTYLMKKVALENDSNQSLQAAKARKTG